VKIGDDWQRVVELIVGERDHRIADGIEPRGGSAG
jgi:hypothetical protein